jgi:hypothetical protein
VKNLFTNYFKVCPKSGKFRGFKKLSGLSRFLFPLIGLAALIWILIRVIPKPSRLNYPCVKTAMPLASGFIGYVAMFVLSAIAFFKSKKSMAYYPLFFAAAFVVFGISGSSLIGIETSDNIKLPTLKLDPNQPMGEAKGIFPGRVVWVFDPDATNKNCSPNTPGDGWFLAKNNNQTIIDKMLSDGLHGLTGKTSDSASWNALFGFYNKNKGKGEVGYKSTEKIFIKINATSAWSGNFKNSDLSKSNNNYYGVSETSPQVVLAVLHQLVDVVGVPQEKIYIGDPLKHIYKHLYDMWHAEFPNVHYLDYSYSTLGREKVTASTTAIIHYSDNGEILKTNVWSNNDPGIDPTIQDYLYTILDEADYMINIPMLKGHKRAGITAFAKNHFGSQTRDDASHLHNGLVAPTELPNITRGEYGLYRVQVDLMGDEITGGKNLLYLMDALWSADQEISYPKKFLMAPFNNDWSSSLFLSLDPVAIESVGYDFLRTEFTEDREAGDMAGTYPQMPASDDYLHQAADSLNWPAGIRYDPENDGTVIGSLGTHEHWDNATDMQYSRNLGIGNGIELVRVNTTSDVNDNVLQVSGFKLYPNYPNPFNPSTQIKFSIAKNASVDLFVYDITGKRVSTLLNNEFKPAGEYEITFNAAGLSSGVYYCQVKVGNNSLTQKMILIK